MREMTRRRERRKGMTRMIMRRGARRSMRILDLGMGTTVADNPREIL